MQKVNFPKNQVYSLPNNEEYNLLRGRSDVVVMNPGYDLEDRAAYESALFPITQRYGMEQIGSYDIVQHLGGDAEEATKLNLWSIPNPEAMQALVEDADYQALEDMRNELHNFNQLTLYRLSEGI
ncbi:hypothetical protein [Coleofasciculus sp. E1-EBD-02]|uniref:hypothetical protein n=1 Tax=Coleofasciculus sp. E1-EBD-02 TaxID=3068481 RepID=UPI0032F31FB8